MSYWNPNEPEFKRLSVRRNHVLWLRNTQDVWSYAYLTLDMEPYDPETEGEDPGIMWYKSAKEAWYGRV